MKKAKENIIFEAFASCRDALVRSIMKMSVKQQDVDDILQETYLRAYKANEKVKINSPKDYLFVVSRNLVIRGLSQQSKEIAMEIDEALIGDDGHCNAAQLHHRQKLQAFTKALQGLPEKHRRAILLRKYYGLSHKEIAMQMDVSVSSVEKYIASGVRRCKQQLNDKGYSEEVENQGADQTVGSQSGGEL